MANITTDKNIFTSNFWNNKNISKKTKEISQTTPDKVHQDIIKARNDKEAARDKIRAIKNLREDSFTIEDLYLQKHINGEILLRNTPGFEKVKQETIQLNFQEFQKIEIERANYFNTLAQLQKSKNIQQNERFDEKTKKILKKRAAAKFQTLQILPSLIKLNSPLKHSYCNTITCAQSIIIKDEKVSSAYCKNRWCQVCNRIKTANLINGYTPEIDLFEDPQFLTLTFVNCTAENIERDLNHYNNFFRIMYNRNHDEVKKAKKNGSDWQKLKYKGIKKLECTYNFKSNTYHPHAHILLNGIENAEKMLFYWFMYCKDHNLKVDDKAQNIKQATPGVCKELFKYFTKMASSTGKNIDTNKFDINGNPIRKKEKKIFIQAMDNIFLSMRGHRVFTSFGITKIVDEDKIENIYTSEQIDNVFMWVENDWIDTETGEIVTNYQPSKYERNIKRNLVLPKKEDLQQYEMNITTERQEIDGKLYEIIGRKKKLTAVQLQKELKSFAKGQNIK